MILLRKRTNVEVNRPLSLGKVILLMADKLFYNRLKLRFLLTSHLKFAILVTGRMRRVSVRQV